MNYNRLPSIDLRVTQPIADIKDAVVVDTFSDRSLPYQIQTIFKILIRHDNNPLT